MSTVGDVTSIGIVIPARDEEDRIADALDALAIACHAVDVACEVVVVDDGSTDRTASLAREVMARRRLRGVVVDSSAGRASTARGIGVAHYRRTIVRPERSWILSTDADTVVSADWVARFVEHDRRGAVAVAGVVDLTDDDDGRLIESAWRADYGATILSDGTHPHVHAANLGVRVDVFEAVGGFGDLPRIEDIDLWRRLRGAGYLPIADARLVVSTSARGVGRVEEGFAAALSRLYR